MEQIRSFIKSAFSYPRLLLTSHPVTTVSIIAATILYAIHNYITIGLGHEKIGMVPMDIFFHICVAVSFFAVFSLCLESIRAKLKAPVKYAIFALTGLLSLFLSFLFSDMAENSHMKFWGLFRTVRDSLGTGTIALYTGGLLVISVLMAIYFSYSHDIDEPFNDHVMNCQSSVFFSAIIYGVIQLGVLLLTIIVSVLLYDDAFEFILPIIILINGLFYIPAVVCALIRKNEKAVKFYQILVRYVMLTISLLAYIIIYIYIGKLIITRSVPSNSVYAILTALFTISMFISYTCTIFENKGLLQKFAYNSPLIFAPFILMQCYTVIVRIGQYGLTPKRYFGIAFIIFEIIYIVYYTVEYRRDGEIIGRNLILVICAIIIVTVFFPGINSRALSTTLAKHTLSAYLEKLEAGGTFTDREYTRANAAAGYLSDDDFGKDRLRRYFSGMDKDMIDKLHKDASDAAKAIAKDSPDGNGAEDGPESGWFACELVEYTNDGTLDISDYSKMTYVNIRSHDPDDTSEKNTPVDASALPVFIYDKRIEISSGASPYMTVDLSDYCTEFADISHRNNEGTIEFEDFRDRIRSMSAIDINENARLYITTADISQNAAGEPVRVDINGYLLEK
ncbi:MAG: DUF4153 domain-containing protein [Lachnospiraceae bacterium]|nr:DUF4153 domain-containing protein [Lachnospiraceae bacterium]